jgi:hypothetical protein
MNLFRSEEHVRKWSGYKSGTDQGIVPLAETIGLFSGRFFTRRLDPDYVSHMQEYMGDLIAALKAISVTRPFWAPPAK